MASPVAGLPEELAGHRAEPGVPGLVLPNGPRYPRIVQAWLWLKKPTWFLDRCSRAYGDVFTMRLPFGMNLVHIARPELVKAVFGGDNDVLRAGEANATILEPLVGPHSVLVLDGPEHLRQRKLILPAFHGDRMRAWEAAVREITRAQIARWPVGKPFALRPSMQSITLDVIVRVVFGVDASARRDELRRHILTLTGLGRNPLVLFATRDRRLGPRAPWARFIRARDALDAALVAEIRQRRAAPDLKQRSDVLSQLLLARDDEGRAMTDDEVRDELVTLLFAGHETTATSLAWAFDLLLHHPRTLARLVAELQADALEYLDATIMETLRVRPVVALVDRHVRQAVRIGEYTIPAGAIACPNIYLAQRRADLYQDSAAFRPDRFVGQTPPAFGWFPFGGGIRRCLGASFATFEMRIVLPEVLQAVTLRPASPRPARIRREAVTLVPHDGARCVVTARIQPTARPLARRRRLPPPRMTRSGSPTSSKATSPSSSQRGCSGIPTPRPADRRQQRLSKLPDPLPHAAVGHHVVAVAAPLHPAALELLVVRRGLQPALAQLPVRLRFHHAPAVDDVDHISVTIVDSRCAIAMVVRDPSGRPAPSAPPAVIRPHDATIATKPRLRPAMADGQHAMYRWLAGANRHTIPGRTRWRRCARRYVPGGQAVRAESL